MNFIEYYQHFQEKANKIKYDLLQFLIKQKLNGKKVIGYGAAAKGNTLLNYGGIKKDLIDYIVEENEIDSIINKYIKIIRTSGPKSILEIKNLVNSYEKMNIEKYKDFTLEKIAELRVSDEGQEGINAFLEKRKTKWSG